MTEFRLLLSAGKSQPVGSYRMTIWFVACGVTPTAEWPLGSAFTSSICAQTRRHVTTRYPILALKRRGYKLVQTRLLVTEYPASGSLIGYGKCAFERGGPGGPLFARATGSGTDPRMPRVFERDSVKARRCAFCSAVVADEGARIG